MEIETKLFIDLETFLSNNKINIENILTATFFLLKKIEIENISGYKKKEIILKIIKTYILKNVNNKDSIESIKVLLVLIKKLLPDFIKYCIDLDKKILTIHDDEDLVIINKSCCLLE